MASGRASPAKGASPTLSLSLKAGLLVRLLSHVASWSLFPSQSSQDAKVCLSREQPAEIESKGRPLLERESAQAVRELQEREMAQLAKLEGSYQRQHKAAFDGRLTVASTAAEKSAVPTPRPDPAPIFFMSKHFLFKNVSFDQAQ